MSEGAYPLGFEVPLHLALTEPMLMGGAPRQAAILAGTIGAAIAIGLELWASGLIAWALLHCLAAAAARRDPRFVDALRRHLRQPRHFRC